MYRFDRRSPEEIFKEGGFFAWGNNYNLKDHITGKSRKDKTSAYVSTSKTKKGALQLWKGRRAGYLYRIKYQKSGREVSGISPFPEQEEIIVPKFIPFIDVIGFRKYNAIK